MSKFVTNAFKFLFDSSSEAGKTIQTVLHQSAYIRQKECKVLIMRILLKLNSPNLFQAKMAALLHMISD